MTLVLVEKCAKAAAYTNGSDHDISSRSDNGSFNFLSSQTRVMPNAHKAFGIHRDILRPHQVKVDGHQALAG